MDILTLLALLRGYVATSLAVSRVELCFVGGSVLRAVLCERISLPVVVGALCHGKLVRRAVPLHVLLANLQRLGRGRHLVGSKGPQVLLLRRHLAVKLVLLLASDVAALCLLAGARLQSIELLFVLHLRTYA